MNSHGLRFSESFQKHVNLYRILLCPRCALSPPSVNWGLPGRVLALPEDTFAPRRASHLGPGTGRQERCSLSAGSHLESVGFIRKSQPRVPLLGFQHLSVLIRDGMDLRAVSL